MARIHWLWRYANADGGSPIAKGKIVTNGKADADGFYRVKQIRGQRDGVKIKALLADGTGIPGNVDIITGKPYLGDNKLRPRSLNDDKPQLTGGGIVFSMVNDTYSNLFYGNYPPNPSYYEFHTVPPYPQGLVPPNSESFIQFDAWISPQS